MPRTASLQAHEAVLHAALQLITRRGIDETSVDDLAEAAGVSKATIYKHWTNKEAVFLEAISRLKCDMPVFDSGKPRSDITEMLRHLATSQKPEAFSKIWPRVLSYAENNPAFANAFRARIACGRRAQIAELLQSAMKHGELRAGIDIDLAMDLLFGPVMYHRFMQAAVPDDLPNRVVDAFWRLNAPDERRPRRKAQHNGK